MSEYEIENISYNFSNEHKEKISGKIQFSKESISYVYIIIVDNIVRYVGKGTGLRLYKHRKIAEDLLKKIKSGERFNKSKFYNKLASAIENNLIIEEKIINSNLTETEAFSVEQEVYFNYPSEQLWNTDVGGRGGFKPGPEHIKNLSNSLIKSWKNPEVREKHFIKQKERWADPKNREDQSKTQKELWTNQELLNKHSESLKKSWEDRLSDPIESERISEMARKRFVNMWADRKKILEIDGVSYSILEWSKIMGHPSTKTIYTRLSRGWSIEEAVKRPINGFACKNY